MTGVDLAGELRELAAAVAELEAQLRTAVDRAGTAEIEVAELRRRVADLDFQLIEAEASDEVYELIADQRRGVISLEELYERTVGT